MVMHTKTKSVLSVKILSVFSYYREKNKSQSVQHVGSNADRSTNGNWRSGVFGLLWLMDKLMAVSKNIF